MAYLCRTSGSAGRSQVGWGSIDNARHGDADRSRVASDGVLDGLGVARDLAKVRSAHNSNGSTRCLADGGVDVSRSRSGAVGGSNRNCVTRDRQGRLGGSGLLRIVDDGGERRDCEGSQDAKHDDCDDELEQGECLTGSDEHGVSPWVSREGIGFVVPRSGSIRTRATTRTGGKGDLCCSCRL